MHKHAQFSRLGISRCRDAKENSVSEWRKRDAQSVHMQVYCYHGDMGTMAKSLFKEMGDIATLCHKPSHFLTYTSRRLRR